MKRRLFGSVYIILCYTFMVFGSVYYVDSANGNDDNDGLSLSTAWNTIGKANSELQPDDSVYIRKGTYNEKIQPAQSGNASDRITYSNYQSEKVLITETTHAIQLFEKSYISVSGIDFYNLDHFLFIEQNSNHNVIEYCTFDQVRNISWNGSKINKDSRYNWVHHCIFSRFGVYDTNDHGAMLDIGVEFNEDDSTYYNIIEDNTFFYGGHHVLGVYSGYNVVRNNYIHNEEWFDYGDYTWGNRNVIFTGQQKNAKRNLFERNRIAFGGMAPDDYGGSGIKLTTRYNIIRLNCFYYNNLPGINATQISYSDTQKNSARYNYIYNNTFYHNGYTDDHPLLSFTAGPDKKCGMGFWSAEPKYNIIINNIFHDNRESRPYGTYIASLDSQIIINNWEEFGDPNFVDIVSTVDPFNPSLPDLQLKQESPCIDSGSFLTSITTADGSGTQFQVEDAGYFTDGWGVIKGDLIQLEGKTERVRITNVDYATNTITVANSVTWTNNLGVSLVYEGSRPDIGAYEYGLEIGIKKKGKQNLVSHNPCYLLVKSIRGSVQIVYNVPHKKGITFGIYDLFGRLITHLPVNASKGTVNWNGKNTKGNKCTSGCYLVYLQNKEQKVTKRFILFR